MGKVPEIVLNSGHKMPTIGFGTAAAPLPPPDQLTSILIDAIAAGYRHFDTASVYGSEGSVGKAVLEAVERGLIKNRDEIFVASKLSIKETHRDLVLPALKETLRNLGLDYVDLYLVHWPVRVKQSASYITMSAEDLLHFDIKGVWEGMEECSKLGLAKSIGVSNFSCAKLSKLLESATIPPAVEMNVAWRQEKMLKFCKEKNIHVCGWSPLGSNGGYWGSLAVMESPILKEIAAAKNKSLAQVALRWVHEQGASFIVKSFNKERMKENLEIFDWKLTGEEVRKIQTIPQAKALNGESYVSPVGQYKSIQELWDGEI
ncbi:hypothetical protein BUALT_Bualt07G0009000 [Buddleja alternifolia]|uniref:NADP-dependent oxidoreductase domain-containing protein n=1 Tax=Buddleja alternifolia TaxID=168488 RepID=A0AAV6X761_9LAMI|nr:hypothetical protein BUALT_Bualt07G0009000 [Buddleja alternifolia]